MPMDAAVCAALARELDSGLAGARLDKVVPVGPKELVLLFRPANPASGRALSLVLSVDGALSRLHLDTGEAAPGAHDSATGAAPPFVLLLRRRLTGCRLASAAQPPWERILSLVFMGPADEFPRRRFTLVHELLGTRANLLLLDSDETVLGALRPLGNLPAGERLVEGARYLLPPRPPEAPGTSLAYLERVVRLADPAAPVAAVLVRNLAGLSPWAARAFVAAAGLPPDSPCACADPAFLTRLQEALAAFAEAVAEGDFTPLVWEEAGEPQEFWVYRAPSPAGWTARSLPTASAAVAAFFTGRAARHRLERLRQALRERLEAQLGRLERRLESQRDDLARAEQADRWRDAGELILANLPRLTRGMSSFTAVSYSTGAPVTVALDPRLTPSENAQCYFERYRKARRGQVEADRRVKETAALLSRVRLARLELDDCADLAELEALASGLASEGLLPPDKRGHKTSPPTVRNAPGPRRPQPRRYCTSDGHEVLVGRDSRENDWLTLRSGAPHDLWLHAKDLAGAHVILRLSGEGPLPEAAVREAAQIAAYHSEGRNSSQVPVDYTLRRHVWKAPGGRPGQVLYDHHRTVFVTPDPALIVRLRVPERSGPPGAQGSRN